MSKNHSNRYLNRIQTDGLIENGQWSLVLILLNSARDNTSGDFVSEVEKTFSKKKIKAMCDGIYSISENSFKPMPDVINDLDPFYLEGREKKEMQDEWKTMDEDTKSFVSKLFGIRKVSEIGL